MADQQEASIGNYDFLDFAQEFLRRNPNYQAQFALLNKELSSSFDSEIFRNLARSWGLEFRFPTIILA